ncbi:hypothetical protein [Glycomyces paridis]|uniref:Uncharacterized protein n=1 Tax=Glycomyces paridis TaxID=2126555 RepID=A0A4S8PA04_9ACTN|nr:hypothetical protein [Glycomyces paridis]THV25982.1 hypothetical protein E9998_19810 [Glycomyces paridis]
MKKTTIVDLIAYTTQLNPAQRFDEYTPVAWHDVLGDMEATFEQCREAIARVARTERWIYPSAIREELQTILAAVNPPPRAEILSAPPAPREARLEAAARGKARCEAAIAAANPYRLTREDAPEIPENLRKAREVAVGYRAGQARRDRSLKLGAAGNEVLSQINRNRKATT